MPEKTKYTKKVEIDGEVVEKDIYEKHFMTLGPGYQAVEYVVKHNGKVYELIGRANDDKVGSLGNEVI